MTTETLNYSIHDVLRIQVKRSKKFDLMRGLDLELFPFRTLENETPDIIFNVGAFKPNNDCCFIVDHKYFVKENYFYCKDSSGKLNWEVEIFGIDKGKMIVNYNYNTKSIKSIVSRFSVESFLLRPIIYEKLAEKGYFMIHSAGVSKNDEAYIFPSRGGAFKTSLVMDFVKRNKFNYLGDDRVILYKDQILSYPAHITLFNYIFNNKENESINLFDRFYFIKSLWLHKSKTVDIPISKSSRLKGLFFISKSTNLNMFSVQKLDVETAVDRLVESSKMEISSVSDSLVSFSISPYSTYMQVYAYIFTDSHMAMYWDNLKECFRCLIQDIPLYEVRLPREYDVSVYDYVCSIIEGIN